MVYVCKECANKATANSVEEIISYRKLCGECLSKQNRESMRRTKRVKTQKPRRYRVYLCTECNKEHNYDFRPCVCGNETFNNVIRKEKM